MNDTHVGKVIDGRYRLDRLLGEGAAGAVYAATQLSVDRTVAVKLLHSANSERFSTEARAIAKLSHTNVITLHDFGFDKELGAHFMVTEFAEGTPLSDRMKEAMSTDLILRIALEVASALHHAHAKGVAHRDLKPENVVLTRADGRVDVAKVLDFGLAHLIAREEPAAPPHDELDAESTSLMSAAMLAAGAARLTEASGPAEATADAQPAPTAMAAALPSLDELAGEPGPPAASPPRVDLDDVGDDDLGEDGVAETAVLRNIDLSADSKFGEEEP